MNTSNLIVDLFTIILGFGTIVIALAAVCVSIFAVGVSLWQGFETKKNFRLAVKPALKTYGYYFINDKEIPGTYITNCGIGPAIITSAIFYYNDQFFCNALLNNRIVPVVEEIIKITNIHNLNVTLIQFNQMINAKESLQIITLNNSERNDENKIRLLRDAIHQFRLMITYKDLYGNDFVLNDYL